MGDFHELNLGSADCGLRRYSRSNSSGNSSNHHPNDHSHHHHHLDDSNNRSERMEPALTLDDIEELTRRRDQLRTDVDTSLVRIAEIQAWVANTTTSGSSSSSGGGKNGKRHHNNHSTKRNHSKNLGSHGHSSPRDPSRAVPVQITSEARGRLRAARAAVSAVPLSEWHSLHRLHPLPPAAVAVLEVAGSLLDEPLLCRVTPPSPSQQSPSRSHPHCHEFTMRVGAGWRSRLLRREPGDVTEAAVHAVRRRRFVDVWPYDRLRRVHPALGPLHRWITALLETREAERGPGCPASGADREHSVNGDCKVAAAWVGSETAALMRELEEHAEYVHLAKDELAAIDALLTDAVREAENCSVGGESTSCLSPTFCSETVAPSCEVSRSSQAEEGDATSVDTDMTAAAADITKARTVTSTEARKGLLQVHVQRKQNQSHKAKKEEQATSKEAGPSPPPLSNSTIPNTTTTEKSEAVMGVGVPAIVPSLALQDCVLRVDGTSTPSLRARLEQLRTSPRMRSPRLGCTILPSCAHSTRSGGCGGAYSQHLQQTTNTDTNADTNNTNTTAGDLHVVYTSADVLQERADLLRRVHELEDRLKEAYLRNPREAEFQLMRDEMNAMRDELVTLRAERNQPLEQTRQYSSYKLPTTLDVDTDTATASLPTSTTITSSGDTTTGNSERDELMSVIIRELRERLHAAHAHIHHLEAQNTLSELRGLENPTLSYCTTGAKGREGVSMESSGINPATIPAFTGCSVNNNNNSNNSITTTTTNNNNNNNAAIITEKHGEIVSNSDSNAWNRSTGEMRLQKQLDAALQEVELLQTALATTEERLNQEIHANRASREHHQSLQAELTSVWRRLESTEYQLKLLLEDRGDDDSHGDRPYPSGTSLTAGVGASRGSPKSMSAMRHELQQFRLREAKQQQELERLHVELDTLRRRHNEQQQQQRQVRAARAEMLRRLERTFGDILRRQECELEAIPNALQRARGEIERISAQQR